MNTPNTEDIDLVYDYLSEETLHLATCAWIRFHHRPNCENRRKALGTLLQLYIMDRYADDFPQITQGLEYAIRIDVIIHSCGPDFGKLLRNRRLISATKGGNFNATQKELERFIGDAWRACVNSYGDDANDDVSDQAGLLLLSESAEMGRSIQIVAIRQALYRGELPQQAADIYQRLLRSTGQTYSALAEEFKITPEQVREEIQTVCRIIREFARKSGYIV